MPTMSEERLWKFRRPEWMNSATARSAGVYSAGALVRRSRAWNIIERKVVLGDRIAL